jgi:hypothetical protein
MCPGVCPVKPTIETPFEIWRSPSLTASDEASHVVDVHVCDDHGADAVRAHADGLQSIRQPTRLPKGIRAAKAAAARTSE